MVVPARGLKQLAGLILSVRRVILTMSLQLFLDRIGRLLVSILAFEVVALLIVEIGDACVELLWAVCNDLLCRSGRVAMGGTLVALRVVIARVKVSILLALLLFTITGMVMRSVVMAAIDVLRVTSRWCCRCWATLVWWVRCLLWLR